MDSFFSELTRFAELNGQRKIKLPLEWILLSNGGTDLTDNIIFFGFEGGRTQPSLVAKVPRLPSNGWVLQTEYDRLRDLWLILGSDAKLRYPEPIAVGEIHGQPVLIISFLAGESLVNSTTKGIWGSSDRILELSIDAAHFLRELHNCSTRLVSGHEQNFSDLFQKIEKFRQIYDPSEAELRALDRLVAACQQLPTQYETLVQGDFWHGNLIYGAEHGKLMLVDWQYAKWATDVSLDVYLFLLAGALAATPDGSPVDRAKRIRAVIMDWRSKIIPAYLSAYGIADRFSLLPARDGMLLCCVEKAVRTVIGFGYNQSDDPIWRALFTELIDIPDSSGFYDDI